MDLVEQEQALYFVRTTESRSQSSCNDEETFIYNLVDSGW